MSTTSIPPLDSFTCARHGWLGHVATHEAAHAVFAVDHDFPFVSVSVLSPELLRESLASTDETAAGGVLLAVPARDLFPSREGDALDLCVAGARAERAGYGDWIPAGLSGDIALWRLGTGRTGALDPAEFQPMTDASIERVDAWLAQRSAAVLDVARALTAGVHTDAAGRYVDFEPITMTAEEVRAILSA